MRQYDREAVTEAILPRLAAGETLYRICMEEGMPSHSTFLEWVRGDEDLAVRYGEASQQGYDMLADKLLAEAEKPIAPADVPSARLAFDARRWWLGKRAPKKYGDKQQVEHSGNLTLAQALDAAVRD